MKNQLLVYTRTPLDGAVYSENLAYSMHLALDTGDGFRALNHNFGVLFALAAENENGTLAARCLDIPYIFRLQSGGFGVLAVCVRPEGGTASPDPDTAGSALVFATRDLCRYDRLPPLKLGNSVIEDIMCEPDGDGYVVRWRAVLRRDLDRYRGRAPEKRRFADGRGGRLHLQKIDDAAQHERRYPGFRRRRLAGGA